MPTVPIVVPIIITGILVGSMIKSPRSKKKRKVAVGSILSGVLNAAYAYVMYELTPTPTSTFTGTFRTFTLRPPSELAFVVSSFVTGLVFVLAILGIALLYGRVRKGAEEPDLSTEETEESKLTLG